MRVLGVCPGSGSGVKVKVERDCTEQQTRDQAPPGAGAALPHRPTGALLRIGPDRIGPDPEDVGCWTFHPLRVMTARPPRAAVDAWWRCGLNEVGRVVRSAGDPRESTEHGRDDGCR